MCFNRGAKTAANNIRVGNLLDMDGRLLAVAKRQHVKPGKGGAFVQLELKDIKTATKKNLRLRASDTVDAVQLDDPEPYRILYRENDIINIMHEENFEQLELNDEVVSPEKRQYLLDETVISIQSYEGLPILVEVLNPHPNLNSNP